MINFYIFYTIMVLFGLSFIFTSIRFKKDLPEASFVFIILSIFIIGLSIMEISDGLKNPESYQDITIVSSNE